MRAKLYSAVIAVLFTGSLTSFAQTKLEQDREAIRSLAGYYEVNFNYAETFGTAKDYKYPERYSSHGSEFVVIDEETPTKIVLQHILVLGDSSAMKHWREDWTYEDPAQFVYTKENTWKNVTLKPEEVKGKWTQKVYQVDDGPRYSGTGTWVHVDGRHQWQSESDSPLPRRESARNDYNILRRGNRIYLTSEGWMFEQDNKKIMRTASGDQLIAQEKGLEEFTKIDPAYFNFAKSWWKGQQPFWKDVREVWAGVIGANPALTLVAKADNKLLYEQLFDMADRSVKEKWASDANRKAISGVIGAYAGK